MGCVRTATRVLFVTATVVVAALTSSASAKCVSYTTVPCHHSGSSDWDEGSNKIEYVPLEVGPCSQIVFYYGSNHDVTLLPDENAYDTCDFSKATLVGSREQGGNFKYKIESSQEGQTLYFADSLYGHCAQGQKLKVVVKKTNPWSWQVGTKERDTGVSVSATRGDVVLFGDTYGDLTLGASAGFPKGSSDCYVTKRRQLTGEVMWTTQFGSSSDDRAAATAIDADGNVIVAGGSTGALFDQQGGKGYWDIFLAKLKGEDGTYIWKKQISHHRSGVSFVHDIAVDHKSNHIFIAGEYSTADHRLPYDASGYGGDFVGFIEKIDGSTGESIWNVTFQTDEGKASEENDSSTGVGQGVVGRDLFVSGVDVDRAGDVVLAMATEGSIFDSMQSPTPKRGRYDIVIAKLRATDGSKMWHSRLGSAFDDFPTGIVIDPRGIGEGGERDIFVGGKTKGKSVLTGAAGGKEGTGGYDAFVVKLSGASGYPSFEKLYGTKSDDEATSVACDFDGNVVLAGTTLSSLFSEHVGGKDVFVIKMDGANGAPLWTKQIGSAEDDILTDIDSSLDNGDFLISGSSMGPFAGDRVGGYDAYVAKLEGKDGAHWSAKDVAAADGWHKSLSSFAVQVLFILLAIAGILAVVLAYFYGMHVEAKKYQTLDQEEGGSSVVIVPENGGINELENGK